MPPQILTSRRALLALAGGTVVVGTAACDAGTGTGGRTGRPGAPAADPDQRLLDSVVDGLTALRERVLRTVERHPRTSADLAPVTSCLETHLSALGEKELPPLAPVPSGTPGPSGSTSPTSEPSPTASPDGVPEDRKEALAAVVTALAAHGEALVGWSVRAESGPFARLLAVMAAGTAQYHATLRKAAR